ncbi:hypothetical protein NQZ68_035024 [Dissostichus eleginoides]|nr:hypothetical protein NQZ68_035024 [Dissostichus eleginoides]
MSGSRLRRQTGTGIENRTATLALSNSAKDIQKESVFFIAPRKQNRKEPILRYRSGATRRRSSRRRRLPPTAPADVQLVIQLLLRRSPSKNSDSCRR